MKAGMSFVFFTDETVKCELLNQLSDGEMLIHNYESGLLNDQLRPYEALVWKRNII